MKVDLEVTKKPGLGSKIYSDVKNVLKVGAVLAVMGVIGVAGANAIQEHQQKTKENELIAKAEKLANGARHMVFERNELGTKHTLELWDLGDTDKHVLAKLDGKPSLFIVNTNYERASLDQVAGDICGLFGMEPDEPHKKMKCGGDDYYLVSDTK